MLVPDCTLRFPTCFGIFTDSSFAQILFLIFFNFHFGGRAGNTVTERAAGQKWGGSLRPLTRAQDRFWQSVASFGSFPSRSPQVLSRTSSGLASNAWFPVVTPRA